MSFVIWPKFSTRNKTAILVIGSLVFLISDSSFCRAQSGLVAAYGFDEGSGTTVKDSSGNNLTGTIVGATWTTGGMYGNALSFNGTSSYVDLGNPPGLQLTGSITIEAWVKAAANPSNDGEIVAKASTAGWLLKTTPDTGPETFGIRLSANSSTNIQRYSTTVRSLNTWYHVAGVYDASAQTLSTYVNGALDNGTLLGAVPGTQYSANVNVNIGRRVSGYYFNGVIDEVRIYNRALSQAEIQTDMITPVSGNSLPPDTTPPTVAISSPMDGATVAGTTALTASASDNVGVAGVQFLLDSAPLGSEVAGAPFTLQWNTSTTSIGTHILSAIARDFSGNAATSDSISVNVSNPSAAQIGQWTGVMNWPMVAVHAELLPTGDVLAWTDYTTNGGAQIWRPATNTFTPKTYSTTSLFCAGHAYMADGRLLVVGGIVGLTDDLGPQNGTIFDPVRETWSESSLMVTGRYYPTATTLPDGRILVQGGTTTCSTCFADMPEIYDPVSNTWTQMAASSKMAFKYYPHDFVLPDGRVLVSSEDDKAISSRVLDLTTQMWTTVDTRVFDGHSSAMYLPGKIIKAGTATADHQGYPAAATTYVLDMTQSSPAWQQTASMAFPRSYLNLTLLPDGTVLATGGSTTTDKANFAAAVYEAELWSPATRKWATMARSQTPRLYYSTALLLPDARVLVAGGGRENGRSQPDPKDEPNAEIFSPPYLFKGARPAISSAPSIIQYGNTFTVATPDAARIASVSLIALSAVTHAFNENQRFVPLAFEQASGSLNVRAPANGNLAPPGPYMLFIVDSNGVPSVAAMTRLPAPNSSSNPAPTLSSISPTSGTTAGGTAITITGAGFLAGATVTLGGTAATGVTVVSSTSITAVTRAHTGGAVSVAVTNPDNQAGSLNNGYTYTSSNPAPTLSSISPTSGTAAGGTAITITGTGFLAGATVRLGGTAATGVTILNSTSITATTPVGAAGAVTVTVTNTDGQSGTLPGGYTYTSPTGGGGAIRFVQVKAATPQTASSSVTVTYTAAQTAGNLNIVAVGWNDTTSTVSSIRDSRGNTYSLALGPTTGTGLRQSIYYARNIAGGNNAVTVTFNQAAAAVDIRALEYSGLDTTSPLDVTAGAAGTGTSASSPVAASTAANELIFGAGMTKSHFTGGGSGFVSRIITNPDADIAEDQTVSKMGNYNAVAPTASASWVMQMATFRASGQGSGNPSPTVTSVTPNSGTTAGGTAMTITGTGFLAGATVSLGGTAAAGVAVVNSTTITATTAAHASGAVNVVVTNSDMRSGTLPNGYTYVSSNPAPTVVNVTPPSGTTAGGTAVTITGTGFLTGATVSLGGTSATGVTVVNSTTITATTATHGAGAVNVVVTNTDTRNGSLPNGYTYVSSNPAPTVATVTPPSGTTAGGTAVTITGTGFLTGATVSLGGTAATGVTVANGTTITAITAAHASGTVNVVVTNTDTQSGTLSNGYTYTASTGGGSIGFVQVKAATPSAPSASVAVTYTLAQTAGNLNIVAVGWNDTTSTVSAVSDSRGNIYALAVGPTSGTGLRQSIYYARNIAAGSNTVTVTFNQAAAFVDVRVLEYRGLDAANPLDVAAGAAGSGSTPSSGSAATTATNELIFGAGMTTTHYTGAGSGFVSRIITTPDADIAEDRIVTTTGNYSAPALVTTSEWVMQMATFRAAP